MSTNSDGRIARLELECRDLKRVASQLLARLAGVEQAGRVAQSGSATGGGGGGGSHVRAVAAGTITEGTFLAPGSGLAQRYRLDAGDWAPDGDPVTTLNQYGGGDIEEGTAMILVPIAGLWFVDTAGCAVDADYVPPEDPPPEGP